MRNKSGQIGFSVLSQRKSLRHLQYFLSISTLYITPHPEQSHPPADRFRFRRPSGVGGGPARRRSVVQVCFAGSTPMPRSLQFGAREIEEGATRRAWRPPPPSRLFVFHYTVGGRNNNGQFRRWGRLMHHLDRRGDSAYINKLFRGVLSLSGCMTPTACPDRGFEFNNVDYSTTTSLTY